MTSLAYPRAGWAGGDSPPTTPRPTARDPPLDTKNSVTTNAFRRPWLPSPTCALGGRVGILPPHPQAQPHATLRWTPRIPRRPMRPTCFVHKIKFQKNVTKLKHNATQVRDDQTQTPPQTPHTTQGARVIPIPTLFFVVLPFAPSAQRDRYIKKNMFYCVNVFGVWGPVPFLALF